MMDRCTESPSNVVDVATLSLPSSGDMGTPAALIRLAAATLAGVESSFVLEHHLANTEAVTLAPITDGRWSCVQWGSRTPPFYPEPDVHPVEEALQALDPMG